MDNEMKQVTYNSSITGETQVTFDIQQYIQADVLRATSPLLKLQQVFPFLLP